MTKSALTGLPWLRAVAVFGAALVFAGSLSLALDLGLARAAMRIHTLWTVATWDPAWFILAIACTLAALRAPHEHAARLWGHMTNGHVAVTAWSCLSAVGAFACWYAVGHEALVTDEFVHVTGASWWGSDRPFRPPVEWEGLTHALYPLHFRHDASSAQVMSGYLPAHEWVLACAVTLGLPALANAGWTAGAVLGAAALARRVYPEHREAPGATALLTACSMQVIWLGGSFFSMPMHLCLSVWWTLLALDRRAWTAAAAMTVSFGATGVHQFVLHGAMAAPFIAYLVLQRRQGRAAVLGLGIGASLALWLPYHARLLGPSLHQRGFIASTLEAFYFFHSAFDLFIYPAQVVAWLAWQHIAWVPLALAAWFARRRMPPLLWVCLASAALAIAPSALMFPSPGRGWGYRYAHISLAFLNLFAVHGLLSTASRADRGRLATLTLATLVGGMGLRLVQVPSITEPQVRPTMWLRAQEAQVLLVDDNSFVLGTAAVRNTPDLAPPILVSAAALSDAELDLLCARAGPLTAVDINDVREAGGLANPYFEPTVKQKLRRRGCLK